MIDKDMMGLHFCTNLQSAGPDLYSETYLTSYDENQATGVKVEDFTDLQGDDYLESILSVIKDDQKVRCMFVCPLLDTFCI
jgi:hypothetical protein